MHSYSIPQQNHLWLNTILPYQELLLADRRRAEKNNAQILSEYLHDLENFFTKRLTIASKKEVLTDSEADQLQTLFTKIINTKRLIEKERGLRKFDE